jgi:hypothetical protein
MGLELRTAALHEVLCMLGKGLFAMRRAAEEVAAGDITITLGPCRRREA